MIKNVASGHMSKATANRVPSCLTVIRRNSEFCCRFPGQPTAS